MTSHMDMLRRSNRQHILWGRASDEWAQAQTQYLRATNQYDPTSSSTGDRWVVKLLSFLLNEIYSLWKQRNDDLHHRQDSREDAGRRRHLKMQIRQLYAKENDVLGM